MVSQMDRFIIVLFHEFVLKEAVRMGYTEKCASDRFEVYRWVYRFVEENWGDFQRRVARERKTLMEVFREEWAAFLTRQ